MSGSLEKGLAGLGMEEYTMVFKKAGFLTWDQLSKITESEMAVLNVRLGERRRLQREFARDQQWPDNKALPSVAQLQEFVQDLSGYSRTIPSVETLPILEQRASVESAASDDECFGYEYSKVGELRSNV